MAFIFKPFKLIIFLLAIFGLMSIEIKGKSLLSHVADWVSAKKTQDLAKDWAKDKADILLKNAKEKVADTLTEETFKEIITEAPEPAPLKKEELIPGTSIPKSVAGSARKAKIIQKLNLQNETMTGDDKKELKNLF
jgi:hypothetical protein